MKRENTYKLLHMPYNNKNATSTTEIIFCITDALGATSQCLTCVCDVVNIIQVLQFKIFFSLKETIFFVVN